MSPREGDGAADGDGGAVSAFGLVTNETRAGVLRELARHQRDYPEDRALSFSALRERVEGRETGNFSYHLEQLRDRFVERTPDGEYRLTFLGMKLAATVLGGQYDDVEPVTADLADPCPVCGQDQSLRYEDGVLRVGCEQGHGTTDIVPPAALDGREVEELVGVLTARVHRRVELHVAGVCSLCSGRATKQVRETGHDAQPFVVTTSCRQCGVHATFPPVVRALHHPDVVSFFADHDRDVRDLPPWDPVLWHDEQVTRVSNDPLRLRVRYRAGGDSLDMYLDEAAAIRRAGDDGMG